VTGNPTRNFVISTGLYGRRSANGASDISLG
jgi:hypothetical protein